MAAFIAAQREAHCVPHAVSCRALGVSQSWFCKWKDGELPPRAARRERLKAEIARLFARRKGRDGSPRITSALREDGWRVSKNTVAGLMRELGLAARRNNRRRATTRPGRGRWRAPDQFRRQFAADGINRRWYGDGTEIPTGEDRLYLDSVLDMGSRRIVGFALGAHHDAGLAYGALAMAVAVRGGSVPGVVFHTDRAASTPRGPLRAALDPGAPAAPGSRKSGQATACPGQTRAQEGQPTLAMITKTDLSTVRGESRSRGKTTYGPWVSRVSSKIMMPLHSRLHPCSGWKMMMWVAAAVHVTRRCSRSGLSWPQP